MRLRSLVLLDRHFAVGRAFGVRGTPSAAVLDLDGRTASSVAAGADAIFTLAHQSLHVREVDKMMA
jgi:hypothetical protein